MKIFLISKDFLQSYKDKKENCIFYDQYFPALRPVSLTYVIVLIIQAIRRGLSGAVWVTLVFALVIIAFTAAISLTACNDNDLAEFAVSRFFFEKLDFFGRPRLAWIEVVRLSQEKVAIVFNGDPDASTRYPESYCVWICSTDENERQIAKKLRSIQGMTDLVDLFGEPCFVMLYSDEGNKSFSGLSALCGAMSPTVIPSGFSVDHERHELMIDCAKYYAGEMNQSNRLRRVLGRMLEKVSH